MKYQGAQIPELAQELAQSHRDLASRLERAAGTDLYKKLLAATVERRYVLALTSAAGSTKRDFVWRRFVAALSEFVALDDGSRNDDAAELRAIVLENEDLLEPSLPLVSARRLDGTAPDSIRAFA